MGIAESLTKRAVISVNLSFHVFLAIVAAACLAAARAREEDPRRRCDADASPLRTFDAHTRSIIESQVSGRRDKWCIGRPIRFHQISAIVNVRLLAAAAATVAASPRNFARKWWRGDLLTAAHAWLLTRRVTFTRNVIIMLKDESSVGWIIDGYSRCDNDTTHNVDPLLRAHTAASWTRRWWWWFTIRS